MQNLDKTKVNIGDMVLQMNEDLKKEQHITNSNYLGNILQCIVITDDSTLCTYNIFHENI